MADDKDQNAREGSRLMPWVSRDFVPGFRDYVGERYAGRAGAEIPERVPRAVGCDACHRTGCHGRSGVFEVWEVEPDDVRLIAEGADEQTLRSRLAARGHGFLLEEGLRAIRDGITTVEEIAVMGGYELGMEADGSAGVPKA